MEALHIFRPGGLGGLGLEVLEALRDWRPGLLGGLGDFKGWSPWRLGRPRGQEAWRIFRHGGLAYF